ncbi:MAG: hypothetical protein EA349_09485 [Halomonadaceae bacterium]|nr:MAG: hypothetical protein EA349_09485 [Halomonadaceae bacterium]
MRTQFARFNRTLLLALCLLPAMMVQAEDVELSDIPLFISATADPNILFILDDSGSMRMGFIPDEQADDIAASESTFFDDVNNIPVVRCPNNLVTYAGMLLCYLDIENKQFAASVLHNPMYFNPDATYDPPLRGDGTTSYPDVSFTNAPVDGYNPGSSSSINLSNNYRAIIAEIAYAGRCNASGQCSSRGGYTLSPGANAVSAFYYEPEGSCEADDLRDECFTRVTVGSDEQQNFANWFSYYRNRLLAARAGITAAFINQPENIRVGYGSINRSGTIERGVRPFRDEDDGKDATNYRSAFFDWLQTKNASGGTPLRRALNDAGQYFETDSSHTGPWASYPELEDNEPLSEFAECRQSFTILMTDGYWNGPSPQVGNVDNQNGPQIRGPGGRSYQYTPEAPFASANSNTLADVAMRYWNRDLQPEIENRVPGTERNPAFWQHMVTYGIGLGVSGDQDPDDAFDKMVNGGNINWPNPAGSVTQPKIDDLLHAAVNSRGGFFSVNDTQTFATELSGVLGQIAETVGSSTGVTFDTATLEEDSLIFAARFDSTRWQGDLDARPLITDDDDSTAIPEIGAPVWSAAARLDAANPDSRRIITHNGSVGVPFRWNTDQLSARQKADLRFGATADEQDAMAAARVAYLRGDRSREGGSDGFRTRDSRLGDIVNSTPVRVSGAGSAWPDSPEFGEDNCDAQGLNCNRYSDFRARQRDRSPVIYAGANDGMLHGFSATENGGNEVLAYMPGAIFSPEGGRGLHHLTSRSYSHNYYVDLPPLVADAFIRGRNTNGSVTTNPDWRTVLIGGARFGSRSIFALDVTNPDSFSEANAAQIALWEFTSDDDDRMGFITEPPIVALARWDGENRWTAFFANGYNSDQAATGFFMLDIDEGLEGPWEEGENYRFVNFANDGGGLSPLAVYDRTGNRIVDRVYAGDRQGRLWVAEATSGGFSSAYQQQSGPPQDRSAFPLFVAQLGNGVPQPITASPLVIPNRNQQPSGSSPDLYVLFGTGQYLNEGDLSSTRQESFYGVRDTGTANRSRSDLARRVLSASVVDGTEVLFSDASSSGPGDGAGWYVDLFDSGERITLAPQVRGQFIFVNSSIPSTNPCVAGGSSRAMAFGLDGLTPSQAVFTGFESPVVSYKLNDGIPSQSAFLGNFRFTPTSIGDVIVEGIDTGRPAAGVGRQSWQELIE